MLSAMARELVERNGIGETADAVWRALNTEHQKLFPTNSRGEDEAPSIAMPGTLLEAQPGPTNLVEAAVGTTSIVVFGQRPQASSRKKRRDRLAAPEQASLFGFS